ncbi:hypothetical protein [Companilactobacillus paralimentarius]|uniref:hypothetical protein n=1 Tax=Companilactobacillus paralimentarius TaxID=83526 RepID=UPI0038504C28
MDYIDKLKQDVALLPNGMRFNVKIRFIERVFDALSQQQLPKYHFPQLELSEDEITDCLRQNVDIKEADFEALLKNLETFDHDLGEFRTQLQNKFGYWATITQDFVKELITEFPEQNFLELMAGNGYLSKELRNLNVETYCTDNLSWASHNQTGKNLLTKVESMDALQALNEYGSKVNNVILAWSPDREDIDVKVLRKIREMDVNFLVIGEKSGATNSKEFWSTAKLIDDPRIDRINQFYSRYDLVHDQLYLVK